jgi:hypothetical protein
VDSFFNSYASKWVYLHLKNFNMRYILLFWITLLLYSCTNSFEKETINIKNQYSIELPKFLSKSKTLNTQASLQYQNLLREFYVIVIDESKDDVHDIVNNDENLFHISTDFDGYKRLITENANLTINFNQINVEKTNRVNTMLAHIQSMEGEIEDYKIYYKLALIEGKKHYYQIFVWTLYNNKKEYDHLMDDIINSFKETK